MILGIFLVMMGVLIIAYPQLLSIIVASILILIGLTIMSVSIRFKAMHRHADNKVTDFFIRY
ncbi:MAG: hypothetical protein JW946_00510 [Candidatus Omnitrophica bacterium]|nr:hypothetical protein [Candidatus Omnitrophota bacterium]